MNENKICEHCKNPRCIGFYLLHPKELITLQRIKDDNLKINPRRTFELITSPSSGEVFTTFKELHVICANDEDKEIANCAEVYIGDLMESIKEG